MTENAGVEAGSLKSLLLDLYEQHILPLEEESRRKGAVLNAIVEAVQKRDRTRPLEEVLEAILGEYRVEPEPPERENHVAKIYRAHLEFEEREPSLAGSLDLRLRTDTADWWRHRRLWEPVLDRLAYTKQEKWLTVGDTFGTDAYHMIREGFTDVLPSSIGGVYLEQSLQRGLVPAYAVENAEALSFADDSFDYVLCREAFHHFPRPMLALYEMIRVARKAVVLIEPQDPMIDHPAVTTSVPHGYERVGNYVYTISRRELEKVALGLDLPALATKGLFDLYYEGVEHVLASEEVPLFREFRRRVEEGERQCTQHVLKHNYLLAVLFKQKLTEAEISHFNDNWKIDTYPGNPYLNRPPA